MEEDSIATFVYRIDPEVQTLVNVRKKEALSEQISPGAFKSTFFLNEKLLLLKEERNHNFSSLNSLWNFDSIKRDDKLIF